MSGGDAFELKHDNVSVYSMDSAYQSQSGGRRNGAQMPEGYQNFTPQDARSRVSSSQFLGGDLYSPTLSSENYSTYADQQTDMSHMQLPSAAGDLESGENSFAYANYTTGQDYPQFTATNIPRFAPSSGNDMGLHWGTSASHAFNNPFNYNAYTRSSNSMEAALYSTQDPTQLVFNAPAPLQRQSLSRPRLDTTVRPSIARKPSSYMTQQHGSRRSSANDVSFAGLVMSPTSAISARVGSVAPNDFEQQQISEASLEQEDTMSNPITAQSVADEAELLSPDAADAAAANQIEEEQGKIARSHPLYQAQPDDSGKYHCPNEGKPGCNHKPTSLKCNYDKYVDSHLKPFRCNKKICVGLQFSSTACLLRHEREAHGMHGHGSRPHLCHFADCERSVPGNGFPRRYNLFDHMKRVHDYTGPTTEPSPPATQGHGGPSRKGTSRKRKSTADESGEKRQKVTKAAFQQQLQQRRGQLQDAFLSKKQNIINILSNLGGPNDLGDDIQLTKEVVGLHEISAEFKKTLGG